jgi:GNAT superfamily N-acetyltransferase
MAARPIRIRRGRRTDLSAVMRLVAESGSAMPPPDRATLRRFRQLVADLGADFYLATVDERVVGVAHVTYARQLLSGPQATLSTLLVANDSQRQGIGTALLRFAIERARKRACISLRCALAGEARTGARLLEQAGALAAGQVFDLSLNGGER